MTLSPRALFGSFRDTIRGGAAVLVVPVALLGGLLVAAEALGCPNCKDAVNTADPEGLNVARGYFYSILLMLAMPCTLLGSFGIYVWRETQRLKHADTSPQLPTIDQPHAQALGPHEP